MVERCYTTKCFTQAQVDDFLLGKVDVAWTFENYHDTHE